MNEKIPVFKEEEIVLTTMIKTEVKWPLMAETSDIVEKRKEVEAKIKHIAEFLNEDLGNVILKALEKM